jgi:hypothetical protein
MSWTAAAENIQFFLVLSDGGWNFLTIFFKNFNVFETFWNRKGKNDNRGYSTKKLDWKSAGNWSWVPQIFKHRVFRFMSRLLRVEFPLIIYGNGDAARSFERQQRRRLSRSAYTSNYPSVFFISLVRQLFPLLAW